MSGLYSGLVLLHREKIDASAAHREPCRPADNVPSGGMPKPRPSYRLLGSVDLSSTIVGNHMAGKRSAVVKDSSGRLIKQTARKEELTAGKKMAFQAGIERDPSGRITRPSDETDSRAKLIAGKDGIPSRDTLWRWLSKPHVAVRIFRGKRP